MTKRELKQVYYLNNELQMWQRRLADLQSDIALSPKVLDGMPFSKTNQTGDPTQAKAIKLMEVSKIIEGKISEIQITIADIDEYILSIEDSLMRQILEYRCCMLMKWDEVAQSIGSGYTAEAVRQMYHRFLNDLPE